MNKDRIHCTILFYTISFLTRSKLKEKNSVIFREKKVLKETSYIYIVISTQENTTLSCILWALVGPKTPGQLRSK